MLETLLLREFSFWNNTSWTRYLQTVQMLCFISLIQNLHEEHTPSRRKCIACLCAVTLISASGPTLCTPNGLAADMNKSGIQKAVCRNCNGSGAIICKCFALFKSLFVVVDSQCLWEKDDCFYKQSMSSSFLSATIMWHAVAVDWALLVGYLGEFKEILLLLHLGWQASKLAQMRLSTRLLPFLFSIPIFFSFFSLFWSKGLAGLFNPCNCEFYKQVATFSW